MAYLKVNNTKMFSGVFNNAIDAAKAYDIAARKYHGYNAVLNFPCGHEE